LWKRDPESVLDQGVEFGFNVMRVHLHLAQVFDWRNTGGSGLISIMIQGDINPYLEGLTTLEILDYAINYCNAIGLKVIFDMHSLETAGYTNNLWYNSTFSLDDLIKGWRFMANRYNNNDLVMGFDLKNEPYEKSGEGSSAAKRDNSTDPKNWKNAAEQIAEAVLSANPNLLVFLFMKTTWPRCLLANGAESWIILIISGKNVF